MGIPISTVFNLHHVVVYVQSVAEEWNEEEADDLWTIRGEFKSQS